MSPADGHEGLLAEVLDLVHDTLTDFVVFPSPEAADAVTLWVAATHNQHQWEHASRLVVKSPVKRCGKTRLLEIVRELVHRPQVAGSISAAALVRVIDPVDPPTIVLDEADTIFKKRSGDETSEALRQVINLGHSRGWPYRRWDAKKREVEECATFGMALIAGIGDLPDTIEDRAVVISMQRRASTERVAQFRQSNVAALIKVHEMLHHAVDLVLHRLDSYTPPKLPVEDRAADVWEPLVAIADAAGGLWPGRARSACVALTSGVEEDTSLELKLLADLAEVWGEAEHRASAEIVDLLSTLDESPWADFYGRKLNQRDLARLLRPYGVRSKTVRLGDGKTAKGYSRVDLAPVWTRYTHDPKSPSQASQASHVTKASQKTPTTNGLVTDVTDVTDFQVRAGDVTDKTATEPPQPDFDARVSWDDQVRMIVDTFGAEEVTE